MLQPPQTDKIFIHGFGSNPKGWAQRASRRPAERAPTDPPTKCPVGTKRPVLSVVGETWGEISDANGDDEWPAQVTLSDGNPIWTCSVGRLENHWA